MKSYTINLNKLLMNEEGVCQTIWNCISSFKFLRLACKIERNVVCLISAYTLAVSSTILNAVVVLKKRFLCIKYINIFGSYLNLYSRILLWGAPTFSVLASQRCRKVIPAEKFSANKNLYIPYLILIIIRCHN